MMRVDFSGSIRTVTELTYSYADSQKKSEIILPTYNGRLQIPGRLMRGKLRHCNFHPIARKMLPKKPRLEDWRFNMQGGILQEGDRKYDILLDLPRFENHPFVGLWGCMQPAAYWGKVQIEIALAPSNVSPIFIPGQRTDPVQRGEVTAENVSDADEFSAYVNSLETDRTDRRERAAREKQRIADRKNGQHDQENADESGPRKLPSNLPFSRWAIPRDVSLEHHMTLSRNPSDTQLGLFLIAIQEFANDPHLGAQTGINAGIVDLDYTVSIDRKPVGSIKIGGRQGHLEMSPILEDKVTLFWKQFPEMDFSIPDLRKA